MARAHGRWRLARPRRGVRLGTRRKQEAAREARTRRAGVGQARACSWLTSTEAGGVEDGVVRLVRGTSALDPRAPAGGVRFRKRESTSAAAVGLRESGERVSGGYLTATEAACAEDEVVHVRRLVRRHSTIDNAVCAQPAKKNVSARIAHGALANARMQWRVGASRAGVGERAESHLVRGRLKARPPSPPRARVASFALTRPCVFFEVGFWQVPFYQLVYQPLFPPPLVNTYLPIYFPLRWRRR